MDSVHSRRQHSLSKAPTQHAHRWWLGCDDAASRKCKCTRNVELEVRTAFVRRCFLVGRATMASSCTSEELASNASTTSSSSCMRLVTRARRLCQELPNACVRLRAQHRLQHCAMCFVPSLRTAAQPRYLHLMDAWHASPLAIACEARDAALCVALSQQNALLLWTGQRARKLQPSGLREQVCQ